MKWCVDITWQMRCGDGNKGHWYCDKMKEMDSPLWVPDDWKSCPFCLTPRPEPKKGLAEKLENADLECSETKSEYKAMAKAAIEHFSEIVDEYLGRLNNDGVELKKRFRESL